MSIDKQDEESEGLDLADEFANKTAFRWNQNIRIILAIVIVILSAFGVWWILS